MDSVKPKTHDKFPCANGCVCGKKSNPWKFHAKYACLTAAVIVALWVVVYSTLKEHPVMAGVAGLISAILAIPAGHSVLTAFAEKKAKTATDEAFEDNPAGVK